VGQYLPEDLETVSAIFRSRGAYSRFKVLLSDREVLDEWYEYENSAQENELKKWCNDNDIEIYPLASRISQAIFHRDV
jgi:hypothetical protein